MLFWVIAIAVFGIAFLTIRRSRRLARGAIALTTYVQRFSRGELEYLNDLTLATLLRNPPRFNHLPTYALVEMVVAIRDRMAFLGGQPNGPAEKVRIRTEFVAALRSCRSEVDRLFGPMLTYRTRSEPRLQADKDRLVREIETMRTVYLNPGTVITAPP